MESKIQELPRLAQENENTPPPGAVEVNVDGYRAFISAPDKYEPMIGGYRRTQRFQIDQLKGIIYSDGKNDQSLDEISREVQQEIWQKARNISTGPNRKNLKWLSIK